MLDLSFPERDARTDVTTVEEALRTAVKTVYCRPANARDMRQRETSDEIVGQRPKLLTLEMDDRMLVSVLGSNPDAWLAVERLFPKNDTLACRAVE